NNPDLQNIKWSDTPEFMEPLKKGTPLNTLVKDLPDCYTKEALMVQDILSILVFPIYINRHFHGFLGFDDCTDEREWLPEEISFLKTITNNLASAIERKQRLNELEELNQHLERQTRYLERSNRELEQFAFITSHQLQEPLRMIKSFLTQLEKRYGASLDERAQNYIRFASEGAVRMREVILDLLKYSRVSDGEEEHAEFDLNQLVAEIMAQNGKLIMEKEADIQYDTLPVISGDRTAIRLVLENLITNGLIYRPKGRGAELTIDAEKLSDAWKISVTDNGFGIKREDQERIFNLFERVYSRDEIPGTGIGLAICKKVVEKHGGEIWVESEFGKGSRFMFTIKR
ncbi:MAG: hypothetical protein LAT80_11820, partial [Balneolaceae bacterium]|nr:hypothetical protein [Balneolaceae bacterium]